MQMTKRKALFLVVIITIVMLDWYSRQPKSRTHYQQLDLNNKSLNFSETPEVLALSVAGYPNVDKTDPDDVKVISDDDAQLTYIITDNNLLDDSLLAEEVRVDLLLVDGNWTLDWAGDRRRCRRGLTLGWTKNRCP
jgi:hypothetical protein